MPDALKVLVCDDHKMICETLQKFNTEKPDFIILDLMMPQKSGTEVCRYINIEVLRDGIPVKRKTYIAWADVERVWLGHGTFAKNKIKLTCKDKKKGTYFELTIKVICSEYATEYILEAYG